MVEILEGKVSSKTSIVERKICSEIRRLEAELRNEYDILNHQDLLGLGVFVLSFTGILMHIVWYLTSAEDVYLRTPITIAFIAFWISFLHELEHDLIHNLYFKSTPWVQDVMFTGIWFMKLHGNPWFRRDLHLKHHVVSGQQNDAEERLIGLGLPLGWKRLAMTVHPISMPIVSDEVEQDSEFLNVTKMNITALPTATLFFVLFKAWSALFLLQVLFGQQYFNNIATSYGILNNLPMIYQWLWDINVLIVFPNIIRQSSLQLMSNASHYYGDIPEKSVYFQNQILDHWMLLPFQLFCCNFGATHIFHHYVPGQPFYIRELIYRRGKSFLVNLGIRCNDLGILIRGNRYFHNEAEAKAYGISTISTTAHRIPTLEKTISSRIISFFPEAISMPVWCVACVTVGYSLLIVFDHIVSFYVARRLIKKYLLGSSKGSSSSKNK